MNIVLDTCGLLYWTLEPLRLTRTAARSVEGLLAGDRGLVVSASFWEIALKVRAGRLDIGVDPGEYLRRVQLLPVEIVDVDAALWLDSVALEWGHRDPVDRLVVALARRHEASIVTSDRTIREWYPEVAW